MLPDFNAEENQESTEKDFNEQFIQDFISTQKARIESRKILEEMLFFICCQVASASLATILFQYAVQVVFTTWLCLFVAWIPSLSSLGEVNFHKTEDGWSLQIMNRPLIAIIKFSTSVGLVTFSIYQTVNEIQETNEVLLDTYATIQRYEHPKPQDFLPPYFTQVVLASIGIVLFISFLKNRNPFS